MSKVYSKPCKIYKMMRHTENPCIVRSLFRHFQAYSWKFSNFQSWSGIFRGIKVYWKTFRCYWNILSHIANTPSYSEPWHIQNPCHLQKACWTSKMIKHIQSPTKVRAVHSSFSRIFRYLEIFRDIDESSSILIGE